MEVLRLRATPPSPTGAPLRMTASFLEAPRRLAGAVHSASRSSSHTSHFLPYKLQAPRLRKRSQTTRGYPTLAPHPHHLMNEPSQIIMPPGFSRRGFIRATGGAV